MDNVIQHLWSTIIHYGQPFKHSLTVPITYSEFMTPTQKQQPNNQQLKIFDNKSDNKSTREQTDTNHQFYTSLLDKIRTQLERRIINVSKIRELGSKLYNRLSYDIGLLAQNQKKFSQVQNAIILIQNSQPKFQQAIHQLMKYYCQSKQQSPQNQDVQQDNIHLFMTFLKEHYVNFANKMDKQIIKTISQAMQSCRLKIPTNLPQPDSSFRIDSFTQTSSVEMCTKLLQILRKLRTSVYTEYQNLTSYSNSSSVSFNSSVTTVKQQQSQSSLVFLSKLRAMFVELDQALCDQDCSLNKLYWYAQYQWTRVQVLIKRIYDKYVREDKVVVRDWFDRQNNIFQYNKYIKKQKIIVSQQQEQDQYKQKQKKIEAYSKLLQEQKQKYTMHSIYYYCQVQVFKYMYMETYIKSQLLQSQSKLTKMLNNIGILMLPQSVSSSIAQTSMQGILTNITNQHRLLIKHTKTINNPQSYYFKQVQQCSYYYTIKLQNEISQYRDIQLFLTMYGHNYDILTKRIKQIKRKIDERYRYKQSLRRSSINSINSNSIKTDTNKDLKDQLQLELQLELQMGRMLDMLILMRKFIHKIHIFQTIDLHRLIDNKMGEIRKLRIQCMDAYSTGQNRLSIINIPFKDTSQPIQLQTPKSRKKISSNPHEGFNSTQKDPPPKSQSQSQPQPEIKMKTLQQISVFNDEVWQFYQAEFKDLIGGGLQFAIYQLERTSDQNIPNGNHKTKIRMYITKFIKRGKYEQKLFPQAIKKQKQQQQLLIQKQRQKQELKSRSTKKLLDKYILQHIQQQYQSQAPKPSPVQLKKRMQTIMINLQITSKMIDINFSPSPNFVNTFHSKFPLSMIQLVEEAANFQYQDWARRIKIFQDQLKLFQTKCKNIGVLHTNKMTSLLSIVYKILKQYTTVIQIACDIFFQILYIFKNTKQLQKQRKGNPTTKPIDLFSYQDLNYIKQVVSYKIRMKEQIVQIDKFNNLSRHARNYLRQIFVRFLNNYENYLPYSQELLNSLACKIQSAIGFRDNHVEIFQVFQHILQKVQNNKGGLTEILQICKEIRQVQIQNRQIMRLGETGLPIEHSCIEQIKKLYSFYRDQFKIADFVCSINENLNRATEVKFMNHKKQALYNKILQLYKAQNH